MKSFPFVVTKYTHEIVDLELAKQWLRMDIPGYTGQDGVIESAIASAVDRVESQCNLQLGISEYRWNADYRPSCIEDVFYVKEITSISYKDGTVSTTVNDTDYELVQLGERRSEIRWNEDVYYREYRGFSIDFKAGFELGKVPPVLLRAIRAMIREDFEGTGDSISEKRTLSDKLMADYKIGYPG